MSDEESWIELARQLHVPRNEMEPMKIVLAAAGLPLTPCQHSAVCAMAELRVGILIGDVGVPMNDGVMPLLVRLDDGDAYNAGLGALPPYLYGKYMTLPRLLAEFNRYLEESGHDA